MSPFKNLVNKQNELSFSNLNLHNIVKETCKPAQNWTGVRDFYSFYVIITGKGVYRIAEQEFPLQAGDSFAVYPDTLVSYTADEVEPWEYLWLGISGLYVKKMVEYMEFIPEKPYIIQGNSEELQKAFVELYEAKRNEYPSELEMIGRTYIFLSKLIQQEKVLYSGFENHIAQKGKVFIDLNYSSKLSPQDVAENLNVSCSHLHRSFSKEFGTSMGKYINQLRMDRSVNLLLSTELSVGEISSSVGFENQLYFSQAFKKYFGLAPSYFKKEYKLNFSSNS